MVMKAKNYGYPLWHNDSGWHKREHHKLSNVSFRKLLKPSYTGCSVMNRSVFIVVVLKLLKLQLNIFLNFWRYKTVLLVDSNAQSLKKCYL